MSNSSGSRLTRRHFLAGGAGLALGICFDGEGRAQVVTPDEHAVELDWPPDAFVRISEDDSVTVICKHTEMGQGVYHGFATIVAEELDARRDQMRVEGAPANVDLYSVSDWGELMTGSSASIMYSFDQLRQVGAAARKMLVAAAASDWSVPADEITADQGRLLHEVSGKSVSFGQMALLANSQPVPETVRLKATADYRYIGVDEPRLDIPMKTDGSIVYTQDIKLPGMLIAVVAHAPRFGARVRSFDDAEARSISGVADVFEVPSGIAVVARDYWTATRARDLIRIDWDESAAIGFNSEDLFDEYRQIADSTGTIARDDGDIDDALMDARLIVEAEYEFPYLCHSSMEPLNCVVQVTERGCEIWNAAQQQTRDQADAAAILGIEPAQVKINMLYAGGAFGRRACKDYTVEAVQVAKGLGTGVPVKLVWTREDDMQSGQFRPLNFHRLRAGIDDDGKLTAWHHRLVGQSINGQESPAWVQDGVDSTSVHGAHDWTYDVPSIRVETHSPEKNVPVLWYRGTGATHTVFAVETFIDEIAYAAQRDPLEYRLELLDANPRLRNVLQLAAAAFDRDHVARDGYGRGIAICQQRDTCYAQVAEVAVHDGGDFSVERVVAAVDCGLVINPDVLRAQIEGGTGFGLSSTIAEEITIKNGYVEQSNFDRYGLLRINQMPSIDVHIVASKEAPSGIGDVSPMVTSAAVANALFDATGVRHRRLPIRRSG